MDEERADSLRSTHGNEMSILKILIHLV